MTDPARIYQLCDGTPKSGPVLYWMSRDQRAENNWALIAAADKAHSLHVPLLCAFVLTTEFNRATPAIYSFMLKGLQETAMHLTHLGIPFFMLKGHPPAEIKKFCSEYEVSFIYCDFDPLIIKQQWKKDLVNQIDIPLFEVDAHNIVPARFVSQKQEYGAYTLRPKIHGVIQRFLVPYPSVKVFHFPDTRFTTSSVNHIYLPDSLIDYEKPPGTTAARTKLSSFIQNTLTRYHKESNNPNQNAVSGLSAWLHFGQLSAQEVALEVLKSDVSREAKEAFLEQLIVRRELADNFCLYQPAYNSPNAMPNWANQSLNEHIGDTREYTYIYQQFESANTHDPLWNAAQAEMVSTGYMHGYMRMYWAKKILEWTPNVQIALDYAIRLNDTWQLDGRDPNGYTGILWSLGGLHDRPWTERRIFGKIRYMNYKGCQRKFDTEQYIDRFRTAVYDVRNDKYI